VVKQERYLPEGIDETKAVRKARLLLQNGILLVETEEGLFGLDGKRYSENK
jgi:hypothetical protein